MGVRRGPAQCVLRAWPNQPDAQVWKGAVTFVLHSLFLLLALFVAPSEQWATRWVARLVAGFVLVDLLVLNTGTAFLTQRPRFPLRTALLAIVALLQLTTAFAVFYSSMLGCFASDGHVIARLPWWRSLYFSLTTLATVGCDITPIHAPIPSAVVAIQIVCGLFFLAVILATFVTWATGDAKVSTIEQLECESDELQRNRSRAETVAS
jgi:hypothetical protein